MTTMKNREIKYKKEIERLNNIINELEKDLIYYFGEEFPKEVNEILDKTKLKDSDKE